MLKAFKPSQLHTSNEIVFNPELERSVSYTAVSMKREATALSEVSHSEKDKYCVIILI